MALNASFDKMAINGSHQSSYNGNGKEKAFTFFPFSVQTIFFIFFYF